MKQYLFLLRPNGVIVSNVHDLHYSDLNCILFLFYIFLHILTLMHIFAYSSTIVFIVFESVIIKLHF